MKEVLEKDLFRNATKFLDEHQGQLSDNPLKTTVNIPLRDVLQSMSLEGHPHLWVATSL